MADLNATITAGREAVTATPTGHPKHAGRLSNLSLALYIRFGRVGELERWSSSANPIHNHPHRP
ncbi:hypothetical protein BL254_14565 [Protofrankia sp. BMG5.30]|nr:hypothetical protein BL254_14565 [Protofrankia sp. BMG5.30]